MKHLLLAILFIYAGTFQCVFSQGWHAVVEVDLSQGKYPFRNIRQAYISFSGATVYGSSATSTLELSLTGEGTPSGPLYIYASGPSGDNITRDITTTYSGNIIANCDLNYFEAYGYGTEDQYVTGTITIYPRLEISNFTQDCDQIKLATNTCSSMYVWEISESISGPYYTLSGSHTSSTVITPERLDNPGLTSRYGRKYIRVRGLPGTTSQIQPINIYPPGPGVTFTVTSPKCHDGADGIIEVDILSVYPAVINDFIITLFKDQKAQPNIILENTSAVSISNLTAGNYTMQIQNNSSTDTYGTCWTEYTVGPLVNPPDVIISSFQLSDYNGYPIKCNGANDGTLQVNPSGGTAVFTEYAWTPNVSTGNIAVGLSEGIYTVKVKDSNNCWSEDYRQALTAPEALSINLESSGGKGGFDVSCLDKTDGVISTIISGGVPDYSYAWSDGSTRNNLSGIGTGTYDVTVTDLNGCTHQKSLTLTAPPPIDFTIAEIAAIRCPGDHSGALEVQSTLNTIGQVYYSWSSGESGKEVTDKAAGMYSLTVSDEQGCQTTKSKTLTAPLPYTVDLVTASDYNGSAIQCHGKDNGKLEAIVRNENNIIATAGYYTWYKNGNPFVAGISHATLEQLTAGIYTVEIEYKDQCTAEKTFVLNEPDSVLPLISYGTNYNGFPVSCYGLSDGSISASATGGTGNSYTYTWETGENLPVLTAIGAGKYAVVATDINGCEGYSEKILTGPDSVMSAISIFSDFNGQPLSCFDASDGRLKATAEGGTGNFTYTWNTGHTGPDLTGIKAGDYTLTASDLNGCTSKTEITIENPGAVKALISEISDYNGYGISCKGSMDGFVATKGIGGTGIYEFTWHGTSYSDSLYEHLSAGIYTVTITDENGCSNSHQATITEPSSLSLSISEIKNIACYNGNDGQVQLLTTGGAGGYEYSSDALTWQPQSSLTGFKAMTYQIMTRDMNGCQQSITQTFTEPSELLVNFINIEPAFCGEARGKATAIATGGTGNYQFEWMDAQKIILSHVENISGLLSGVYTVTAFDDNHCQAVNSVGITSADGPHVIVSEIASASCSYSFDGSALLEITKGNGPFSIRWPDGRSTLEALNLSSGDYLVEITDNNDCTVIETVTITAPDSLDIILSESVEPACNGDCNGKLKVMAKGGTGNYQFQWSNLTGSELTNLCAGSYEIKVSDDNRCISEKLFHLGQPKPIEATLTLAQSPVCRDGCDGKLKIEASGGTGPLNYVWSSGESEPDINGLCAGTYSTLITDANHCTLTETYTLQNPPGPTLDLGGSVTLCAGQTHMLDPGSYYETYSWSGNTGFTSTAQRITIGDAGMYWLEAFNDKGCIAQDTFLLETAVDLLKANFLLTTEAMERDTVVLIDISWPMPEHALWNFPDEMKRLEDFGDIVYGQFERSGLYEVSLTATLGECHDKMTKSITITDVDEIAEEGRLGHEPFVKEFTLYPNPNEGMFDVSVEFLKESPVMLSVWNILTARKIGQVQDSGGKSYLKHIDLRPLSAGTYTLRLDYSEGTRYLRFIVR